MNTFSKLGYIKGLEKLGINPALFLDDVAMAAMPKIRQAIAESGEKDPKKVEQTISELHKPRQLPVA